MHKYNVRRIVIMDSFYKNSTTRSKLIDLLNDSQKQIDSHLSKAIYYKYLAQQTLSLFSLYGFKKPLKEEIQSIEITKKIPEIKVYDTSLHPSMKALKGEKLERAIAQFEKYYCA